MFSAPYQRFEKLYPHYDWRGVQFELRKATRKSQSTYDPDLAQRYINMLATAGIRTTVEGNGWNVRFYDVILTPGQQTDLFSFLFYIAHVDQHLDPIDQQISSFKTETMSIVWNSLSIGEGRHLVIGEQNGPEMRISANASLHQVTPEFAQMIASLIDLEKKPEEILGTVS